MRRGVALLLVGCAAHAPAHPLASSSTKPAFAANPHEPFAPRPLTGPWKTLDDFCRHEEQQLDRPESDDEEPEKVTCTPRPGGPSKGPTTLEGAGWLRRVVVFPTAREQGAPVTECNLGLETARGWYVDADAFDCYRVHLEGQEYVTIKSIDVERFLGDHDLVVRLTDDLTMGEYPDPTVEREVFSSRTSESFFVCAVGPSGTPSCTPQIPTITYDAGDEKVTIEAIVEAGTLVLTVPPNAFEDEEIPDDWRPLAGRHVLVFP